MPRFFFNTSNSTHDEDTIGTEFDDERKARLHAIRYAGEVIESEPDSLLEGETLHVQMTDESGAARFRIETRAHGREAD